MTSIKDVAQLAGVSVTTVSHVLNKTRAVHVDTEARVLEAVRTLGYVPSAVARSLKMKATHTIGMLVPNNSNPYFAELVRAVEDACFAAGYALLLCNTDDNADRQRVYLDVLAQKRVDGVIVASTTDDERMSRHLADSTMPMVLIDRDIDGLARPCVQTDHVAGGAMATGHLLALGHRRIACIAGPEQLHSSESRVQGWREAMQRVGLEADLLVYADFTVNGGYLAMRELLSGNASTAAARPTAVFACNDLMAMGALRAVHEQGLSVPQDVALVGYDDIELASYTQPALATVAQPVRLMAKEALACLLALMSGAKGAPRPAPVQGMLQLLAPSLVTRASSGRALERTEPFVVSGQMM